RVSKPWRVVMMAAGVFGVFITLMVVSTSSQLAMQGSCPVFQSSWPAFWSGQMAANRESMLLAGAARGAYRATDLGRLMGLHGLGSLGPFVALWGIVCVLAARILRSDSNAIVGRSLDTSRSA